MRAQVKRSEWVAKSRECGALWEKDDDDGVLFFGFFQADGREHKRRGDKTKTKRHNTKKNKTKQNKQTEISLVLYLSTHT